MNKKGQIQFIFNPKSITFFIGGAIIGYLLFQKVEATLMGGLIGLIFSFIK